MVLLLVCLCAWSALLTPHSPSWIQTLEDYQGMAEEHDTLVDSSARPDFLQLLLSNPAWSFRLPGLASRRRSTLY